MTKRIKVMAYYQSTGIWSGSRQIKLSKILKSRNEALEKELWVWQAFYNAQFNKYPFDFDWDAFNQDGREIARKVQRATSANVEIYYVESDDREFYYSDSCSLEQVIHNVQTSALRIHGPASPERQWAMI